MSIPFRAPTFPQPFPLYDIAGTHARAYGEENDGAGDANTDTGQ